MMRAGWAILAVVALAPTAVLAQAEFNGQWKFDTASAKFPTKPDVLMLKNGVYTCSSCVPFEQVKADGAAHAISGSPYYDSETVTVVDDHTISGVRTKAGAPVGEMTETVSPDGQAMTMKYVDRTTPSSPVTGTLVYVRVAPAAAGAHAISGSWRANAVSGVSDNGLMATLAVNGPSVSYSTPSGQSYTVHMDGTPGPYVGDPGITTVSVTPGGARTLVETDYRDGRPITVSHMTVSPDGRRMTVMVDDKLRGTTATYTLLKQ